MTIGIMLGTGKNAQEVYSIAEAVGFSLEKIDPHLNKPDPIHRTVPRLRLQIHKPCYHKNISNIITEIEFDDQSDDLREKELENISGDDLLYHINLGAAQVLKNMYEKIPDLIYLKSLKTWLRADDRTKVERPPLSHYFETLK